MLISWWKDLIVLLVIASLVGSTKLSSDDIRISVERTIDISSQVRVISLNLAFFSHMSSCPVQLVSSE